MDEICSQLVKENYHPVFSTYACFLAMIGRDEESWKYNELALELDPEDRMANMNAGMLLYDQAILEGSYDTFSKSLNFYIKAAKLGQEICLAKVGYMYEFGQGVEACQKTARKYYKKAWSVGHVGARYRIANTYFKERKFLKGSFLKYITTHLTFGRTY